MLPQGMCTFPKTYDIAHSVKAQTKAILAAALFLATWGAAAHAADQPAAQACALTRPGEPSGPTKVEVAAWFADVSAIDSANQTFTADLVVRFRWLDPSLARPGNQYSIHPKDAVWSPPWIVANGGAHNASMLPDIVKATPDGEALIRQHLQGTFTQRLNLARFPFDEATFAVRVITPGLTPQDIEFSPDAEAVKSGLPTAAGITPTPTIQDWQIKRVRAFSEPYQLVPGTTLPGYTIEFTARRLRQHYIVKVLLPLALIVIMAMSVFWIDPSLGASQVSVAVTSMLTLIAYRFAIGNDVPKLPYLTLLDAFILVSTGIVFLALIEVVLTTKLASNGRLQEARAIDRMCRWIFPLGFVVATGSVLIFW